MCAVLTLFLAFIFGWLALPSLHMQNKTFPVSGEPDNIKLGVGRDDGLIAYLELALRIYLRIKREGQPIHRCGLVGLAGDSPSVVSCISQKVASIK